MDVLTLQDDEEKGKIVDTHYFHKKWVSRFWQK
jgi:hypothetical protein